MDRDGLVVETKEGSFITIFKQDNQIVKTKPFHLKEQAEKELRDWKTGAIELLNE